MNERVKEGTSEGRKESKGKEEGRMREMNE